MDSILRHRGQIMAASGLDVLAGVWLLISPWILSYTDIRNVTASDIACGIIVIVLSALRFLGGYAVQFVSWVVALIGIWVLISPWVLAYYYYGTPLWNNVITGIVIIALACWSGIAMATENRLPSHHPPMPQT